MQKKAGSWKPACFFVEEPECKPEKLKKPYLLMAVKSGKVIF